MKFSKKFLDKLLESAINFHNTSQECECLPLNFNNIDNAITSFADVIRFEANKSMQNEIIVDSAILHAVNLNTKNPGIISEEKDKKILVHKEKKEKTEEQIAKDLERQMKLKEKREIERQKREKEKEEKKFLNNEKKELKGIEKDLSKMGKNIEKKTKKKKKIEKKIEKHNHCDDDIIEYDKLNNELGELEEDCTKSFNDYEERNKEYEERQNNFNIIQEQKMMEKEEKKIKKEEKKKDKEIKQKKQREAKERKIAEEERLYMEQLYNLNKEEANEDEIDENESFSETSTDKVKIYESPLPFQRHLEALEFVDINEGLIDTILEAKKPKKGCSLTIYHGPPGTGKTYKLIETLSKLIEKEGKNHNFLICAASNIGTLNLYNRAKMFNIFGNLILSKDKDITDELKNNNVYFSTVSMRYSNLMKDLKFHTIMMDEAAQCQESWSLGLLRNEVKHIYLAGDPHQLPAVVSDEGNKLFHSRSLMARLMEMEYPSLLLDVQRRMHPDIVQFSNKTFYDSKLKTDYTKSKINLKAFDIIDIDGQEQRKGTSYQNETEALRIIELVKELDIKNTVIISPYQAQCRLLKSLDETLEVHTIDSFQGRESDAIILTTVRNGEKVGFWNDYRRLNVGLTRARHVLRIVGNVNTWMKQEGPLKLLAEDVLC